MELEREEGGKQFVCVCVCVCVCVVHLGSLLRRAGLSDGSVRWNGIRSALYHTLTFL
jgi:hypothetical protein